MRCPSFLFASLLLSLGAGSASAVLRTVSADPLSPGRLRAGVEHLASDVLRGRDTGSAEIRRAEGWIASRLKRAGLEPLPGEPDFFLEYDLWRRGFDPQATELRIVAPPESREPGAVRGRAGAYRPFDFSDDGAFEAEVVFAGYGIVSEEHGHDDYAGLDVEGKWVLVLRHEPGEDDPDSPFDGTESTEHALFTTKAEVARSRGASGMLLVTDPLHHAGEAEDLRLGGSLSLERPETSAGGETEDSPFLAVHVSRELARGLVEGSGRTLLEMQRAVDAGELPASMPLPPVRVAARVTRHAEAELVPARNVAAMLPGADPSVADEWIVVGAHHDHLGGFDGEGDTVYNGADDNASGTMGLIALAESLSGGPALRRPIVFMTFSGEEKGLLGSRAVVQQELIPIDDVAFMLNLDMIGRNETEPVEIVGDGFATGLAEIVITAAEKASLAVDMRGGRYFGRSDHDPFYRADVPFLFFFTGTHDDYHQLGDHADRVGYERMGRILEVARSVLTSVANAATPPRFIHRVEWLGATVEPTVLAANDVSHHARATLERALVTAVAEGSRAERAGLAIGDVIVGRGDERLREAEEVGALFRAIEPGTTAELRVLRGGEPLSFVVERARRGWFGVFPGSPSDEQRQAAGLTGEQGLLLRRVVPDGPAAEGGLRDGDVVLEIAGRAATPSDLGATLAQVGAGETVDVLVFRDGERVVHQVTLGERPRR